jgi:hypothetical protein
MVSGGCVFVSVFELICAFVSHNVLFLVCTISLLLEPPLLFETSG